MTTPCGFRREPLVVAAAPGIETGCQEAKLDGEAWVKTTRAESLSTSRRTNQIWVFRAAWKEVGNAREPRMSVSRSIFALVDAIALTSEALERSGASSPLLTRNSRGPCHDW